MLKINEMEYSIVGLDEYTHMWEELMIPDYVGEAETVLTEYFLDIDYLENGIRLMIPQEAEKTKGKYSIGYYFDISNEDKSGLITFRGVERL